MAGSVLLIVVESAAHRALFNRYLGNTAHHLVFATDGEDGFDRFGEVKPDLVIAHLDAPGVDGTILCQLIRKQPRGDFVPYVILGEELTDSVLARQRMSAVGADGWLPFPFDRQKLIEAITPLLTFGRMEPSNRRPEPVIADPRRGAEIALEKLRSVQVSPELAIEQRTEAAPPRASSFARAPSNVEEVPARALGLRTKTAAEELHEVVSAIEDESNGIPIEDPIESHEPVPHSGDDEEPWNSNTDGLLAEPEAPVVGRALAESADTVVSFVNPFLQGTEMRFPTGDLAGLGGAPAAKTQEVENVAGAVERTDGAAPAYTTDPKVEVPQDATQPADFREADLRLPRVASDDEATYDEGVLHKQPLPRASSSRTDGRLEPKIDFRPEVITKSGPVAAVELPRPSVSEARADARGEVRAEARVEAPRTPELRHEPVRAPELRHEPVRAPELRHEPVRGPELRHEPVRREEPRLERPREERLELRPERREELLEEPPIIDRPARDPLEELPISGIAPVPNHSDSSVAARLIHEPVRELTPSASDRSRKESLQAGARRGLDESQLGKRLAKRVRTMYRLLDEVDYYQILGVDRDANADVLKRAYFDLSLEFHPDRFFLLRSGDLKEKIYAIYRRVTEAHAVLSDERRRRAYDEARFGASAEKRAAAELREDEGRAGSAEVKGGAFDVHAASPKAKRLIELARAAMDEGDVNGARLHLHLALAYEETPALRHAIDRVAQSCRP